MLSNCPEEWELWKQQRTNLIQEWSLSDVFSAQFAIAPENENTSISSRHLLHDFFMARIPAGHFQLHKGIDRVPRFSSPSCPRYLRLRPHPQAGLGHRLSNFLQGVLLAETFGLHYIVDNLDSSDVDSDHGGYDGMTDFLGLILESDTTYPSIQNLTFKQCTKFDTFGSIVLFLLIILDSFRVDLENVTFTRTVMDEYETGECGFYYVCNEFWPGHYYPAYPRLARRILPKHFSRVNSLNFQFDPGMEFNREEVNVCIHLRLGDWAPTPPSRYIMQIKLFFQYLDPTIPANVYLFYQFNQDQNAFIQEFVDFFQNEFTRAKLILRMGTEMTELVDTILLSDVFMTSDSSLDTHLSLIAQRPIVFQSTGCIMGEQICLSSLYGYLEKDASTKVFAEDLGIRWNAWQCASKNLF